MGTERPQHSGIGGDPKKTGKRDRYEPDHHDRAEQSRDFCRAARLHRKQHKQDHDRQRHDVSVKCRRRDVDAFDCGQHRKRRRDDGVAIEQRGADDAEQRNNACGFAHAADGARGQRHQGQRAALAVVVGAQQDHDVFQRDDDEERPQDQRHDAEHRRQVQFGMVRTGSSEDRFAQCVERACADIAIDDADAADGERPDAAAGVRFVFAIRRRSARDWSGGAICHERNRPCPLLGIVRRTMDGGAHIRWSNPGVTGSRHCIPK